jgi:hypothetical protein
MTRREQEIVKASVSWTDKVLTVKEEKAFQAGARWADATIVERLRELKSGYENDLDAEPRVYERDIQLFAKISLIERLILELKEEEK